MSDDKHSVYFSRAWGSRPTWTSSCSISLSCWRSVLVPFSFVSIFFITWWRFGCNDDPYWMICLIIVVSLCHFTSCQRDCRETKEEVQRYVVFLNIGSMSPCTWCMGMDSLSQPIASSWCFLVLIFADSSVDVNDDDCVDCDDDLPSKRQHAGE